MQHVTIQRRKLNRREARDLDVEIDFLEGLLVRSPDYVDALRLLSLAYSERGRYDEALRIDEQLTLLLPRDPRVFYNLACSYSLAQQPEHSITALGRALNRGYHDYRWLLKDPDLAAVRQHPLFRLISERIQRAWLSPA